MSNKSGHIIRQFDAFKDLNDEDSQLLGRFAQEKKFPANAALLRAGQICSHVYLLLSCQAQEVQLDNSKTLLSEGAVIGAQEILEGKPMQADFIISKEGSALVIPGTALEELILLSPTLAAALHYALNP